VAIGTFVMSHYLKLAEHLQVTLSAARPGLGQKQNLSSLSLEKVEGS